MFEYMDDDIDLGVHRQMLIVAVCTHLSILLGGLAEYHAVVLNSNMPAGQAVNN